MAELQQDTTIGGKSILDLVYPVGSIYMSINSTNPSTLFGGTWVAWGSGRVPVGYNSSDSNFNASEKTGGSSTTQHRHDLASGYAYIETTGPDVNYIEENVNWTPTWKVTASSSGSASGSVSQATRLGGYSNYYTSSTLQPYITCYMWKRTA